MRTVDHPDAYYLNPFTPSAYLDQKFQVDSLKCFRQKHLDDLVSVIVNMSRRKQAKPRSLKHKNQVGIDAEPAVTSPRSSSPCPSFHDSEDSLESEALGTEAGSSWSSEGNSSPPSSCATPNSASDLPDSELTFTVGVTEGTPYGCQFCNKAFPRLSYLKKHEQTHSEHLPFVCEFCKRRFKHKRSKDRHLKLHTGDKRYKCAQCEAAFARSDHLKIHMKTHDNQKPFQCTVCNRGYNTAAALTSHMQNHKKPSEESNSSAGTSYRCLECAKVFTKPDDLTAHIMNEHYLGPLSPQKKRKSPRPRLACIYCTKDSFHSMEALQLHVQAMHGSILNGSHSLIFSLGNSGSHETAQTGTLACHLCTMTFPSLQALQVHGSSAHGKKNDSEFQCSLCGVSFPSYIWLVEHFNTSHHGAPSSASLSTEQSKPTDLSFNRKEQRDRSPSAKKLKNLPTSTSPIVSTNLKGTQYDYPGVLLCNQCDAALPDFESFRSHLKSHLEESVLLKIPQLRPSQLSVCPYCGVKVHSSQEMIQHMEVHFKSFSGDFECQICFQGFKLPEELQKHLIENHTQHLYRCSLCKDLFESKVAIQVHYAMKHCTEKKTLRCSVCLTLGPFQSESEFSHHVKTIHCSSISACSSPSVSPPRNLRCAFCHATFSTDSELQFHLAVHTKQFQCKYCSEAFHVEYLLEKHIKSNHVGAGAKTLKCDETRDKVELNSYDSIVTNGFHLSPLHMSSKSMGNGALNSAYKPSVRYTHEESTKNQDYVTNNNVFKTASNTNSNGNPFKGVCEVCALGNFSSEAELHSHRQMAHHVKSNNSSKMSLHCAYCKENCKSRSELENHMKAHCQSAVSSNKYKCNICDEMCLSVSALAEHKLTHCKVIFGSICTHCKIQIHDEESFLKHVMHHTNSTNGAGGSTKNQLVLPVACVICRQTLGSEMETRLHAKFHLQVELTQCSMCLQSCDKKDLKEKLCQHCQSEKATPAKCLECCVKFETHGALDLHMLMAHDRKGDYCKKCKKKFETEEEFKMHMENHFNSENRNAATKCNLCMLIFPTLSQLQIHLIEHTFLGCSNYTCYICSSVFTTPVGLQTHILDHGLSARPYDCSKCMKKFFFRAELDNHISLHIQNSAKTTRSDNGLNQGESSHNETKEQETTKMMNESQKQSMSHYENKIRSENNERTGVFKNENESVAKPKSTKVTVKMEPDSPEDEKLTSVLDRTENTDSSIKTKDD